MNWRSCERKARCIESKDKTRQGMIDIKTLLAAALLLLLRSSVATNVPVLTVDELRSAAGQERLASILATTGLLSISAGAAAAAAAAAGAGADDDDNDNDDNDELDSHTALEGLCHCPLLHQGTAHHEHYGIDSAVLSDGTTVRHTLATATVGTHPLPLPSQLEHLCGTDTLQQLETLRDVVARASLAFVAALDALLEQSAPCASSTRRTLPLLKDSRGKTYSTLSSIVTSANHLEHFHLYDHKPSTSDDATNSTTLHWHTDAGLFLAFIPGHVCGQDADDDSFWFQTTEGHPMQAAFQHNSVAIMLGAGAQHWLNTQQTLKLQATRHALKMTTDTAQRAWYGIMHLVPESAFIQQNPPKTFKQLKQTMVLTKGRRTYGANDQHATIGCGPAPAISAGPSNTKKNLSPMLKFPRQRLLTVTDPSTCNNVTNFFCWMSCLDIPEANRVEAYVKEGYSLYCLDPSMLDSGNSVQEAMEPCQGDVHNYNCLGRWEPNAPGVVPSAQFASATVNTDLPYCYGGTSMYMDGFHWVHSTTCIIYLFPQWILSSRPKLLMASLGTIAFGALLEFAIYQRRRIITNMNERGNKRLAMSALFYAAQLTMGYMLMLVVMTFSGVLFFCTILGVVIGHVLFNAKDALLYRDQKAAAAAAPTSNDTNFKQPLYCCARESVQSETCADKSINENGVPEGSTPCCQHTL